MKATWETRWVKGQRELKKKGTEVGDKKGSRKRRVAEENLPQYTISSCRFREFEEIWESTLQPALVNVLVVIRNKGVNILNSE